MSSRNDAGVVCQDLDTLDADCTTGSVRLVNGTNKLEGRVEVCLNNAWGTVCDSTFSEDEASIICNSLPYPHNGTFYETSLLNISLVHALPTGTKATRASHFGGGSGPIFLQSFRCNGSEDNLLKCVSGVVGVHTCDHSQDAGVQCLGI